MNKTDCDGAPSVVSQDDAASPVFGVQDQDWTDTGQDGLIEEEELIGPEEFCREVLKNLQVQDCEYLYG